MSSSSVFLKPRHVIAVTASLAYAVFNVAFHRLRLHDLDVFSVKNIAMASPALKIKVDVYGGSITECGGAHWRYSDIVGEEIEVVGVENNAIGGSGPHHWIHCGINPAEVIVSEFRINERNPNLLEKWYMMTNKYAQHTIILDIWSWLNPPSAFGSSQTEIAFNNLKKKFPHVNQTFSILSLSDRDRNVWREKVPAYFNYTGTSIPEKCFSNVLQGDKDKDLFLWCRQNHGDEMQHGRELYHRDVASSLVKHMTDHVLPLVSLGGRPSLKPESLCVGTWGSRGGNVISKQASLDTLVVGETNFQISSPLSRRQDKMTLNTNSTSSTVRLDCPVPYNSMILGHIMHSSFDESVLFEANGKNISTHDHTNEIPHIRTRSYTEQSFRTPVDISVSSVRPGAYLELTDVVCRTEA